MSELHARCLDVFPDWLRTLPKDATELSAILESDAPTSTKRYAAGALNYLFKSLDLIPDGIEDLGFLDDAFVLRVAARHAATEQGADAPAIIGHLAEGAGLIEELLGADYARLSKYVTGLRSGAARGRTVDEIVDDATVRGAFMGELTAWASGYQPPSFTRDDKTLVKLTSFLSAKLPA